MHPTISSEDLQMMRDVVFTPGRKAHETRARLMEFYGILGIGTSAENTGTFAMKVLVRAIGYHAAEQVVRKLGLRVGDTVEYFGRKAKITRIRSFEEWVTGNGLGREGFPVINIKYDGEVGAHGLSPGDGLSTLVKIS